MTRTPGKGLHWVFTLFSIRRPIHTAIGFGSKDYFKVQNIKAGASALAFMF
jgi:hypothetical protein